MRERIGERDKGALSRQYLDLSVKIKRNTDTLFVRPHLLDGDRLGAGSIGSTDDADGIRTCDDMEERGGPIET